uniref:Uncharacterized protein n=1 Tax=Rhizophagus irregularis (strain DAOM 181602 / DAOM 197198 / MUCL 43194) TaxID=747089 RepID=U9TIK9_RHIID
MTPYNAHIVKTQHLGFCSTLTDTINMILTKHQRILFDFIDEHTDDIITYYFCNEEITKLALFQPNRPQALGLYCIRWDVLMRRQVSYITRTFEDKLGRGETFLMLIIRLIIRLIYELPEILEII